MSFFVATVRASRRETILHARVASHTRYYSTLHSSFDLRLLCHGVSVRFVREITEQAISLLRKDFVRRESENLKFEITKHNRLLVHSVVEILSYTSRKVKPSGDYTRK